MIDKKLRLKFHGRIVDHLGIQMYQSPVASLAELIANAWDADAETVEIALPSKIAPCEAIVIRDTGVGMTFEECEDRYLNVGYNRRGTPTERTPGNRPILGRKGIGKFAGFGIASTITIDTISKLTGERTKFLMRLDDIRSGQYYSDGGEVPVVEYLPPDENRKTEHGTTIILSDLTLGKAINACQFSKSMSRRFLLHQRQANFDILVSGNPLPEGFDLAGVEYEFPRDYREGEKPPYLGEVDASGWGVEKIDFNREIRWRFFFHKETIDDEELRGIVVFVHGKIAQTPFLFHIAGGLKGQHGIEYLSGQIDASYLDEQSVDLIATDRQGINWEQTESRPLLEWGAKRVKELLKIWQDRRSEDRLGKLDQKMGHFAPRLENMTKTESKTIRVALGRLASISTLSDDQFQELGGAMLTSFERGRLKNLIDQIANTDFFTAEDFVQLLAEADVLSALNLAEVIRTKLEAIRGLERLVEKGELENKVRDYIADRPWLLDPNGRRTKRKRA